MEPKRSQEPDLLGYVFDALEPAEQSVIESLMEADEALSKEVSRLRRAVLTPLALDDPILPPVGLAERTIAAVGLPALSPSEFVPSQSRSFASAKDMLVAVVALSLLVAFFFPAAYRLHREGDRLARTEALRQYGSQWHAENVSSPLTGDNWAPRGHAEAAIITSVLHQATQLLPSASVVLDPIAGTAKNYAPTLTDLMKPPTETFVHFVASHKSAGIAGFYPRGEMESTTRTPVAADPFHPVDLTEQASAESLTGNILFADGHVAWVDH